MAKANQKQAIDNAFQAIIGGQRAAEPAQPAAKPKKPSPLGVPLAQDEIEKLTAIALELGVKRHHLLVYAVRAFLASWAKGERPKIIQTKNELKVD